MKTAYFDCSSGISGDMCLGALVDAGAVLAEISVELEKLKVSGYTIESKRVTRGGLSATKVDVLLASSSHHHSHDHVHAPARRWKDIKELVEASSLSDQIKQKGLTIFGHLFEAEAAVHGETVEKVHLHELAAVDCIVDIFGTIIGLDLLGIEQVVCSSINTGQGKVKTAHGLLPVPAPATAELLKGAPIYSSGIEFELTTPTGAAILRGISAKFGPLPDITLESIGYGAGGREIEGMPNALRILIGEVSAQKNIVSADESVVMIETNIDDMNPQYYESVMTRLFEAGALDVFLENIIMKKGRPAIKLSVLINSDSLRAISDIIFSETTTIGIRMHELSRIILDREIRTVDTQYGPVRFKVCSKDKKILHASAEYDDLRHISEKTGRPIKELATELSSVDLR